MKVTRIKPEPVPDNILIELTEKEAQYLKAFIGNVGKIDAINLLKHKYNPDEITAIHNCVCGTDGSLWNALNMKVENLL